MRGEVQVLSYIRERDTIAETRVARSSSNMCFTTHGIMQSMCAIDRTDFQESKAFAIRCRRIDSTQQPSVHTLSSRPFKVTASPPFALAPERTLVPRSTSATTSATVKVSPARAKRGSEKSAILRAIYARPDFRLVAHALAAQLPAQLLQSD